MNRRKGVLSDGNTERVRGRILAVTTASYVGCFAVWTIFAIIGIEIQREYHLSDTEFGLLVGTRNFKLIME
jgi:NNP family nitrate/nitrite transporter-like MFS transporter